MGQEISTFGNIEIEKNKLYRHKTPIFGGDVDTEKVLVSNKISLREKNYKCFIGYYMMVSLIILVYNNWFGLRSQKR